MAILIIIVPIIDAVPIESRAPPCVPALKPFTAS